MTHNGTHGDECDATSVRELHDRYAEAFGRIRARGHDPGDLGDPAHPAARVVAATPPEPSPLQPSPLEDLLGPFYATTALARWLGITRQAIHDRIKARTLLGMQTGDRAWVYPAWQFTADRQVIPHLPQVLHALAAGIDDPWTWALWLSAPNQDWDDKPAWQWLADGGDPLPVITEARADAARWQH